MFYAITLFLILSVLYTYKILITIHVLLYYLVLFFIFLYFFFIYKNNSLLYYNFFFIVFFLMYFWSICVYLVLDFSTLYTYLLDLFSIVDCCSEWFLLFFLYKGGSMF